MRRSGRPPACSWRRPRVLGLNALALARRPGFAWWRFRQVAGWMLLVYVAISGMIEYAFVYDHTRGMVLVVMTLLLAIFTLNVPLIAAFTVAQYEQPVLADNSS